MLKSPLYEIEIKKKNEKDQKSNQKKKIEWGNNTKLCLPIQ